MATALSAALTNMYLAYRPGWGDLPTGFFDGTVSELVAGDYLVGARSIVVSTGATTGGLRALTLERSTGVQFTVNWPATATLRFGR